MQRILLVEDEEFFRDILKNVLLKSGFAVEVAQDGNVAKYILGIHDFDIVISDIRMPGLSGIELLNWIKTSKPRPVILMTGFSDLIETKNAYDSGASGFLPKPFTLQDLLVTIKDCLQVKSAEPEQLIDLDSGYCKIGIDDFIAGREIPYSIYIRLAKTKYTKIAYQGEDIELERIRSYKSKDIRFLYLMREDFRAYVGMNLQITKALGSAPQILPEKKQSFLRHTGEVLLESLYLDGVDENSCRDAREFMESTIAILSDSDESLDLLMSLNDHADFLYAHSLGVSLYGVMIAKTMGWHSAPTLFKVSVGGLLHDIGKKEIDRSLFEKPRTQLTQPERTIIETHTTRGMELLRNVKSVPIDIAQIAYQHHESCTGYGFPLGLTKNRISPLARLISVANVFCEYAIKSPHNKGMSGVKAITQMIQLQREELDPEFFSALMRVFKYDKA